MKKAWIVTQWGEKGFVMKFVISRSDSTYRACMKIGSENILILVGTQPDDAIIWGLQ